MKKQIEIVILADSASLPFLRDQLDSMPDLSVMFAASDPEEVLAFVVRQGSNVSDWVALVDGEAPGAGPEFIKNLRDCRIAVVAIVSSANEGFKLMSHGASNMVVRRPSEIHDELYYCRILAIHISETAQKTKSDRERLNARLNEPATGKIIAVGSSTGGTETVLEILKKVPANAPPILVVQHMPPVFTKMYAERVNSICEINVWEARDGDRISNGLALIAPGDYHMTLEKSGGMYTVACKKGEKVCNQCPSVDVLFESVARTAGHEAVGVILTGMGEDGAQGMMQMRRRGAYTIGQDEESCVVYGMPRAAYELGAVAAQLPLDRIPGEMLARAGYGAAP